MARICIPDHEYKERVQRAAAILQREKLDVLIVNGNEADYANPRYFSGFWPLFERAGVAIAANGEAALMVGPESAIFGADRNKLDKIFVLKAYREGADPSYPELQADTFDDVFKAIGVTGKKGYDEVCKYFDTMFGIQKTLGNMANNFRKQMNAAKSIVDTVKAAKDGTLDEAQAEKTLDTLDAATYGDRSELIAKADAALASVK